MNNHRQQVRLTAALCLGYFLAGCDLSATAAPRATGKVGPAYELVTVRRPVSVPDYVHVQKQFYELCKAAAALERQPVKPFVEIPKDFVMERQTRLSDGTSFAMKLEQFGIDVDNMLPEHGCASRISKAVVLEHVHNDAVTHIDIDPDGRRVVAEPLTLGPSARVGGDSDAYTERRTLHGVPLMCIPRGGPGLAPGVVSEHCIVDGGKDGPLREPDGNLVVAYQRDELSSMAGGSASILEPVSLTVGKVNSARLREAMQ